MMFNMSDGITIPITAKRYMLTYFCKLIPRSRAIIIFQFKKKNMMLIATCAYTRLYNPQEALAAVIPRLMTAVDTVQDKTISVLPLAIDNAAIGEMNVENKP